MDDFIRGAYTTDAGMLAVWDPQHFRDITDYDTWETQLLEDADISRHIQAGAYVPLYIHSDGTFGCEVRVGTIETPAALTPREQNFLIVTSAPYLFRSDGEACVSGIEYVGSDPPEWAWRLSVSPGEYAVIVQLLAWDEEPGSRGEDGRPVAEALPDFLVLLNPVMGHDEFRTQVDTFDPPSVQP